MRPLVERLVDCPKCRGTGLAKEQPTETRECSLGSGERMKLLRVCPRCLGPGVEYARFRGSTRVSATVQGTVRQLA